MSTVQFNLLPDVKLDYAKAQHSRTKVTSIAMIVGGVSLGILILLFLSVNVVQKKQLSDATKQIDAAAAELEAIPNLTKVLTVQNQLQTLSSLHQQKHITSRTFTYFSQLTPSRASLGQLTLDLTNNSITISGTADSQQTVNTFIDTLKFAKYQIGSSETTYTAFPSVIESSFSINPGNVSYTLNIQFDPKLFGNDAVDGDGNLVAPKLTIKNQTTSRSVADDPNSSLFNGQTGNTGGQ